MAILCIFSTYLKTKGINFTFGIIFANGARVFYLCQIIADFLESHGTPNRLLKAVLEDIKNDVNLAGCKALGLVDKLITGPL